MSLLWLLLLIGLPWSATLAESLPDPTRPPPPVAQMGVKKSAEAPQQWVLGMTRVSGERKLALLNGRVVREGDEVNGARILKVEAGAVTIEQLGAQHRIALPGVNINKQARTTGRSRERIQ